MPEQGPSAVATTTFWVTSEAGWRSSTLHGNGSMLAFCEAVFWSALAARCWVTSEAAWDSRTLNGDGWTAALATATGLQGSSASFDIHATQGP